VKGILALDLANSTGWAHSDGTSGVVDFKPKRGESPGMRYVRLRVFLDKMSKAHPFELVAYEQPHHLRSGAATEVLVGLLTRVQEWCAERGLEGMRIEHTNQSPTEVKKHAVGKGKASKLAMMLAAERKWGFEPKTDDEADALWLLDLVKKELGV
jgi:Holliday junction resolvasome RuvABC endonuclease subunit